jgi:ParB family chromosome partitioning protein
MVETKIVPVDNIVVGARKRPLSEAKVAGLESSIAAVGLLQPIVVTDTLGLVAGHHRLEAARRLGWATIPARVAPLDALRAELAEIDENLIRQELTALEEAEHLQRRVEILEALGERAQARVGTNQHTPRDGW